MEIARQALAAAAHGWVAGDLPSRVREFLGFSLKVGSIEMTAGGLLAALITVVAVSLLSRVIRRGFVRYAQHADPGARAGIYTVSRISGYVLTTLGLLLAVGWLGIPVSQFAVVAGAIGVGLGFGLQAIFNNFVSGLILLFDRSLKMGDFVELASGVHGEVKDIGIRATVVRTNDNIDILVPNSEFVNGRVTNWTHEELSRRMRIPFGVAYGSDKDVVRQAAMEAAAAVPHTLSLTGPRQPDLWLVGFGESSLDFELVIWLDAAATKRPSAVKAAYNWALHDALMRHGLEIPFPQRDLHLRSGVELVESLAAIKKT